MIKFGTLFIIQIFGAYCSVSTSQLSLYCTIYWHFKHLQFAKAVIPCETLKRLFQLKEPRIQIFNSIELIDDLNDQNKMTTMAN